VSEHDRARAQHGQLERLREGLAMDLAELPYLFAEQIGRPELERLADVLGDELTRLESLPSDQGP
jgi:hypothetical protein